MKVKFREVKTRCRQVVKRYRKAKKDDREFPQFLIHCLSHSARKGEIHLYRKERGKEAYMSKGKIHYKSIAELRLIMERLGRAWEATSP